MIDLLVSIVNHNHAELLPACLDSVFDNLGSLSGHVVVLDNASTDGSKEMIRQRYPTVELIARSTRNGFAANQNYVLERKLKAARYVLLLNDDTVVGQGTLEYMVRFMEEHSDAGLAGARLTFPDGSPQASFGAFPTVWGQVGQIWRLMDLVPKNKRLPVRSLFNLLSAWLPKPMRIYLTNWDILPDDPVRVDWVCGACMLARSSMVESIGLLDADRFFMYFEDVDWCKRASLEGWATYFLPRTAVLHVSSASRSNLTMMKSVQSACRYFEKYGSPWDVFVVRANTALKAAGLMLWSMLRWVVQPRSRARLLETVALNRDFLRVSVDRS